ncbi:MAG TPA: DUF192 domain-containing protein [Candidatus Binatia bacterium]|nr:DUF192 domain-containing protein [Candidatus Binatia bacterium]
MNWHPASSAPLRVSGSFEASSQKSKTHERQTCLGTEMPGRATTPTTRMFLGLLTLLLFLTACTSPHVTFHTSHGDVVAVVEVADDAEERAKGLMYRQTLAPSDGMLFIFEDEAPRTFWMKNTKLPLDMIFVDSNLTVDEVKSNVPPCKSDSCPVYPSKQPAQYVIEVGAGYAEKKGIEPGTRIDLTV